MLARCCHPRTENSDLVAALCVGNDEKTTYIRPAHADKTLLVLRVSRIGSIQDQWIGEDRGGLAERHSVFFEVDRGFVRVPFKILAHESLVPELQALIRPGRVSMVEAVALK
jgi:hypothetical protein